MGARKMQGIQAETFSDWEDSSLSHERRAREDDHGADKPCLYPSSSTARVTSQVLRERRPTITGPSRYRGYTQHLRRKRPECSGPETLFAHTNQEGKGSIKMTVSRSFLPRFAALWAFADTLTQHHLQHRARTIQRLDRANCVCTAPCSCPARASTADRRIFCNVARVHIRGLCPRRAAVPCRIRLAG